MSSNFNIEGAVQEVYACTECGWCQTKKHLTDEITCLMCNSDCEKVASIQPSTGMSDFKYRELLAALNEDADGVGDTTVENIQEHFEEGDDFLSAAKDGYQEMEFDELKAVDGVGKASAKSIALTIADEEGWDDGALFEFNR